MNMKEILMGICLMGLLIASPLLLQVDTDVGADTESGPYHPSGIIAEGAYGDRIAYIDDKAGDDHYATLSAAMAVGDYDVFCIGKDLEEDAPVVGNINQYVMLERGHKLTVSFTYPTSIADESDNRVDFRGVKTEGDLIVGFRSIHITGGVADGEITIISGTDNYVDGDTVFRQGSVLILNDNAKLTVSPDSKLVIEEGVIVELGTGSSIVAQAGSGTHAKGEIFCYSGETVSGDQTDMVRVYNAAPAYLRIVTGAGTSDEKELAYGDEVPAGTTVTVSYVQALGPNLQVHSKTFWQDRGTDVTERSYTLSESTWFYADYEDYDGTSAHGMIWEGNGSTHDLTVQHHYANFGTSVTPIILSTVNVPFAEGSFEGTRPHFTYRVIHLAEPGNPENPDPYVVQADTYTQSYEEDINLVLDSELLPGKYYLTAVSDDGMFGFVNYMFIVKGHDYRMGLTWEASAGGGMQYRAWIADINEGSVQTGDVSVEGFIDGIGWADVMEGHFDADGSRRPVCVGLSPIGGADPSDYSGLRIRYTTSVGTEFTQDISFYGTDSSSVVPIDDLVLLAGPIEVFDITEMRAKYVDSLIIFRASNDDLRPEDALDCVLTTYYVTGPAEWPSLGSSSFELTVPSDRYLVTMSYGIENIRHVDPLARELLVYEVTDQRGKLLALEICDPVE